MYKYVRIGLKSHEDWAFTNTSKWRIVYQRGGHTKYLLLLAESIKSFICVYFLPSVVQYRVCKGTYWMPVVSIVSGTAIEF